jgi:predicted transcriptional regulator
MKKVARKRPAKKRAFKVKGYKKAPKASTIRLKPELQSALDRISDHLDRPKNKLVNQAVAEFLEKTSFRLREDIEDTLENLRAYRAKDPNFEADIDRFAEAEAAYGSEDTHEGKMDDSVHSLSKEIRELIHA